MIIDAYFCGDYNHSFDTRIYPEGKEWVCSVLSAEKSSWEFYYDGNKLLIRNGVLVVEKK